MNKRNDRDFLSVVTGFVISALSAYFSITYLFVSFEFTDKTKKLVIISVSLFFLLSYVVSVILKRRKKIVPARIISFLVTVSAIITAFLYVLEKTGISDKFSSIDALREYVSGKGALAVLIMVVLQFLQVAVLPIPGIITTGASVALFGPFKGAVVSFTGIYVGSVTAFIVGRRLGYKVIKYLVGKENFEKARKLTEGKDKIMLTAMFLLPFFPDDLLCFVAGLSSMTERYFFITVAITRFISVFTTAYSLNGSIIPFDTEWGASLWSIILLATAYISLCVYKNGDAVSEKIKKIFNKKVVRIK